MLKLCPALKLCTRKFNSESMAVARTKLKKLGGGVVSLEHIDNSGIAKIIIDQEDKKNALSGKMMVDLENTIKELENWTDGKAIMIEGKGDFFCSGGDLTTVQNIANPQDGVLMSRYMQNLTSRIVNLPLVSASLVHGGALGGGAELTTFTDFRIFTDKATVSFVQAKMAVSTGWGGGTRLTRLLGPSTALELLLSCRKIDHNEAQRIGLANLVVPSNNRHKLSLEWLTNLIRHDRNVVLAAKDVVNKAAVLDIDNSLKNELKVFSTVWGAPANLNILKSGIRHR